MTTGNSVASGGHRRQFIQLGHLKFPGREINLPTSGFVILTAKGLSGM
jgi:hypothetical protein